MDELQEWTCDANKAVVLTLGGSSHNRRNNFQPDLLPSQSDQLKMLYPSSMKTQKPESFYLSNPNSPTPSLAKRN